MTLEQRAEQFRKALQMYAGTLDEEKALEIATVFAAWDPNGKTYKAKEYLTYGENSVGDPQLYVVLQDHTSQPDWTPDTAASLYKAIGITDDGYPEWVQPVGASDAYMTGDVVSYNGKLYRSTVDNNVWSPEAYPAGWEEVTGNG